MKQAVFLMHGTNIYGWMEGKKGLTFVAETQDTKFTKINENEFAFS